MSAPGLTPELLDRLKRIAKAESKTLAPGAMRRRAGVLDQVRGEESPEARGVVMSNLLERMQALEARIGALGKEPEIKSIWRALDNNIEELTKRIEALEQHPERLGSSEKHIDRRVEALERQTTMAEKHGATMSDVRHLRAELSARLDSLLHTAEVHARCFRCEQSSELGARIEVLERGSVPLVPQTAYTELHNRMTALESRLPQPIPVVEPLTQQQVDRMQQRSIESDIASGHIVMPTPDYHIDLPPAVEQCGCEESESLRAELGAASVELRQMAADVQLKQQAAEHYKSRADKAESECATLRAEVERLRAGMAESERARLDHAHRSLVARVERDEARRRADKAERENHDLRQHLRVQTAALAEDLTNERARLADADALLAEAVTGNGNALAPDWASRVATHLSGQPAAQSEHVNGCKSDGSSRMRAPAPGHDIPT